MVRDGFQLPSGVLGGLAALGISPVFTPQGRLTLTTVTPVLTATVSAAGTVFYTPYVGNLVPVQFSDGGGWSYAASAEVSNVLANSATGNAGPAACVANSNYDLFGWMNAGVFTLTRGPYWQTAAATVTISIANPAVVAWNSHGLQIGDPVTFTTTGALPHGGTNDVVAGTTYFVIAAGFGANSFEISLTVGGAAINTTGGSQSGVHTAIGGSEVLRGTGAGTTELKRVNGLLVNANAITNGPAAGLGTYLGTIRTNATATTDMKLGAAAANGTILLGVFNAYNRVDLRTVLTESTVSWTYNSSTYHAVNGSGNSAGIMKGLNEDVVEATHQVRILTAVSSNSFAVAAIGLDSTTAAASPSTIGVILDPSGVLAASGIAIAHYQNYVGLGWHVINAIEKTDTTTVTYNGASAEQGLFIATRV